MIIINIINTYQKNYIKRKKLFDILFLEMLTIFYAIKIKLHFVYYDCLILRYYYRDRKEVFPIYCISKINICNGK